MRKSLSAVASMKSARHLRAVVLLLIAGCGGPAPLEVSDARVRALIPGQDKTVGYFNARNSTGNDIVLTGARADGVRAIEMHTTIRDGDVARMRRLSEVVIAAGDTVRFEPGGRHLMLFGVGDLGETTEIVLETGSGDTVAVTFETFALGAE